MFFKKTWIAALSLAMATASIGPVSGATSLPATKNFSDITQIQQIQHRRQIDRRHGHSAPNRNGWYNGHRGYHQQRRGYRRHSDGWWYPLAAFGAGAALSEVLNNSQRPQVRGYDNRHYQWCSSRYRTYRASDNSFVPRVGQRASCNSPYN